MSSLPLLNHAYLTTLSGNSQVCHAKKKEKILQFGTGVLLRALPDYYLQKANDSGIYEGSVVVVKTTDQGDLSSFENQNFLFTQVVQGIEDGKKYQASFINSTISRILKAKEEWSSILDCAANPDIRVIISNVTEQGLVYKEENIQDNPPESFPAKLLACLWHRFETLGKIKDSSVIVLPTELIDNNGDVLKSYVRQCAEFNHCSTEFMSWFEESVAFSNTLVDRIVPGKPESSQLQEMWEQYGYVDHHLVVSEPYHLWAIEKKEGFEDVLAWCLHDHHVKWVDDIQVFKELKLRLLNAVHILSCGYAWSSGFTFVAEAMENRGFQDYLDGLIAEIKKSMILPIANEEMDDFAKHVKERFANPYLAHAWTSIMVNYSDKMKIRALPLLTQYYHHFGKWPSYMLLGWAQYFILSTPSMEEDGKYYLETDQGKLLINDPTAQEVFSTVSESGFEKSIYHRLKNDFFKDLLDEKLLESLHSAIVLQMKQIQNPKIQHA